MAMPPPTPVDPKFSLACRESTSCCCGKPVAAAARRASSASTCDLLLAWRPTITRSGVRRSVISTSALSNCYGFRWWSCTLLRRQLQAITNPKLGQNMLRARRVVLEFLAKTADEHPEVLNLLGMRRSPDLPQQIAMRQHLSGMGHEMPQQLELFWRELDLLTGATDMPADEIDRQIIRNEDGQLALRLESVAQPRAYPGHQFRHAERLADVVVSSEIERLDLGFLIVAR